MQDLGSRLFECEKYPALQSLLRASGGWKQIAYLYLFGLPIMSIVPTAFLALGLEWLFGKGFIESHRTLIWALWILVITAFYALLAYSARIDYRYFSAGRLEVFEKGIVAWVWSEEYRWEYDQIDAVYFGAKRGPTKLPSGNKLRPKRWWSALPRDFSPLRIEFKDGTNLLFPHCLDHFKQQSIEKLLSYIARKQPDLFPQLSENPAPR